MRSLLGFDMNKKKRIRNVNNLQIYRRTYIQKKCRIGFQKGVVHVSYYLKLSRRDFIRNSLSMSAARFWFLPKLLFLPFLQLSIFIFFCRKIWHRGTTPQAGREATKIQRWWEWRQENTVEKLFIFYQNVIFCRNRVNDVWFL